MTTVPLSGQLADLIQTVKWPKMRKDDRELFKQRWQLHGHELLNHWQQLYSNANLALHDLIQVLVNGFAQRSRSLKALDAARLAEPDWFRRNDRVGMAMYVDLYAGDFQGLIAKIPQLQQQGINYLHLMPLYLSPEGNSDGGYAVSDYRQVDKNLGSNKDLAQLAQALRTAGISLVLDFVFNHTADEHAWAKAARQGQAPYNGYYYFFDEQAEVDAYNQTCREIFPSVRRGSFTYLSDVNKWVWTTFNSFQWDLNYRNPHVFTAITDEMLYLANIGCEALRLDALAFIWKEKGTLCESLPQAHTLIRAFNACLQIVAPAVVFKSEAIVHPDEVVKYIDKQESQLSYNPLLMALMWESLATRETKLLTASLKKSFAISEACSWVNYIRCHDDIGWTFDDEISASLGINGYDHRRFLNNFYTGQFAGSFAKGVPFQANPTTGDCRVCGSLASLAGLECALENKDQEALRLAQGRIYLLNSLIMSIGGIPLLFQGDEVAALNDYRYLNDEFKQEDSRWVNRPDLASGLPLSLAQQEIATKLSDLIKLRKSLPVLGNASTMILETYRPSLFAFVRARSSGDKLLVIANFSEQAVSVPSSIGDCVGGRVLTDQLSGEKIGGDEFTFMAYQVRWLTLQ
ncbi:MAG: amylosucrase [Shewanella sp.]|uniref:amylosucrase n=1 Tax=Shewanella sp. TaxID=50422 RepID=UPI003F3533B4